MRALLALALSATLSLAACGDDSDSSDAEDYAEVFQKISDEPDRWTRAFRNSPLYARYVSAVTPTERSAPRPAVAAAVAEQAVLAEAAVSEQHAR